MPTGYTSQDCWGLCPWPHSRPLSTHASARDSQTFTGKSALVSCGVTAPFTWVLVRTKFYLFSSVAQSCSTLYNPMDCSMPRFPVHHHLPEVTQTHVRWVSDAIQPSHSLSYPSPIFNISVSGSFLMSQFFTSGGHNTGVSASASVRPMNIQDWFLLGWTVWISLQSKGLSRVFSNTQTQKHQFLGAQLSL